MNANKAYDGPTDDDIRWCVAEHLSNYDFNAWIAAHDAQVARNAVLEMAKRFQYGGWFNALVNGDKLANANHVTAWMRDDIAIHCPEESLDA